MPNFLVLSTIGMERVPKGGKSYLNTLQIALWINNFVPIYSSSIGAFTEASYHGYARQNTTAWADPVPNALPPDTDMTDNPHGFVPTDSALSQTVYGFFLIDPADGNWIMAQPTNLSPPQVLSSPSTSYVATPRLTSAPYAAYP